MFKKIKKLFGFGKHKENSKHIVSGSGKIDSTEKSVTTLKKETAVPLEDSLPVKDKFSEQNVAKTIADAFKKIDLSFDNAANTLTSLANRWIELTHRNRKNDKLNILYCRLNKTKKKRQRKKIMKQIREEIYWLSNQDAHDLILALDESLENRAFMS